MSLGRAIGQAFLNITPSLDIAAVKGEMSKLNASISGVGTTAGKNFSSKFGSALKVGMAAASTAAIYGLSRFTKESINQASTASESINAINVAFGDAAQGVLKLSEGTAKRLGVSGNDFRSAAVRFSAFAQTIGGKDSAKVVKTVEDLTSRATDFASVYNIDVADALALFQSSMAGETEPIRKFGIDMSAAAVEAYAAANGIGRVGEKLSEGEKQQARYGLLMQSTSKVQGDFANTSDGLANQQRILDATMTEIQVTIGTALLPMMQELAQYVMTNVVPAIQQFAEDFKAGKTPVNDLINGVKGFITYVAENWDWISKLGIAILGVAVAIKAIITAYNIWKAATQAFTIIQAAFNLVMSLNPISLIVIAVAALVAGIIYLATQTTFFQDLWTAMVAGITAGWNAFVSFFGTAINAIGGFFSSVFDGIGKAFKGYINFWIGLVEGFINFFITGINGILKAINSIKFTAPDWVPFIGGKSWGANIPMVPSVKLPRLADGGMVMPQKGGTQAILAEAGKPEVVYPLDRFEKLMGLNGAAGAPITVNNYAPVGMDSEQQITRAIERARTQVGW